MSKVKIATDWLAGCAGCHMSFLDIDDRIVKLMELVEFTSSPITDLKHPPKEGVTVGILEGAICNTHNVEVAKMMRERCQILIALGDCATFGNIPAMRNFCGTQEALKRAYIETESTVDGFIPDSEELGVPLDEVVAIDKVVKVDLFIPGCPPSADAIFHVLSELLAGHTPVVFPPQYFKYD
ncbi:NAD-reducing hydrogenase small subunit [Syntrophus gentianae]|uniref:NAD-reducing hydrogenase small subunit n=1 Tax=Syntrophus gentianae TaxID=43775 RepID=A0A1H7WAG4_9BACT|nr:NADP oxidoreductase [Syntrophus gentianae]SEM18556.1 NAD-reducing hydrogenase small subunit [Syntrophus gentianae]